jgi:glycosyltransferase involved in cell wall biosynthesis
MTSWWNWYGIRNQISGPFFYYPVELMIQKGFNAEVLTCARANPLAGEKQLEEYENLRVYRFVQDNAFSLGIDVFSHIAKRRYSLIHMHDINWFSDYMCWIASRIKNVPMVVTSHAHNAFERFIESKSRAFMLRQRILEKWFIVDSPTCVFVAFTRTQAEVYRMLGIRNIEIIPHGIDPKVFEVPRDPAIPQKYDLGEFNILCVGAADFRKGQHFLVNGMPKILSEFPDTRLIIVARAYQKEYLKMLKNQVKRLGLQAKVKFYDEVPKDELIQLYLASSIFCLPTRAEMFGLVFLEAMGAGLPIVTTNRPYIKEILGDGEAGILVQRHQQSVENAILKLLGDKSLRRKLGSGGRKLIRDKYCLDDVIQKHWQLYKNIMEAAQNSS